MLRRDSVRFEKARRCLLVGANAVCLLTVGARTADAQAAPSAGEQVMAARSEDAPRPGYHREYRYRKGLLISGAIVAGVGLGALGIGAINDLRDDEGATMRPGFFYLVGGICVATGIPLFTVGLFAKKPVDVRDDAVQISISPVFNQTSSGLQLNGVF